MSGFTFDESTQLASLGLNSAQIAAARTQFDLDPSMLPADTTLQQILRNAATTIEAQIPALEGFYRNAAVSAGRTNVAPTASFTVSPQGGPAPLQVTFTSTSTSSDLDPLTVSWNFGDGSTGQGPSVMHTYTADGTYTVTQTVSDGVTSVTAQRFINVGGVLNHDPVAMNDTMTRGSHAAGVVNVLANDTDSDSDSGDFLVVSSSTNGAHGMVLCNLFGTCTYTPTGGFTGPDSFTYTISDAHGGVATATVNVTINPPAAPTPVDDTLNASPPGLSMY